jgi:RNA polymerase sigma-70 factor (ECF subfamily)
MLVVKYQRRIQRLIGRMVRDVDLVPDIAQGPSSAPVARSPVPWRQRLLRLAVPDRGQHRQEVADGSQARLVTESARANKEEDDERSPVENRLSDGATPDAVPANRLPPQ